jgi:hypothetical protein
MSVIAGLKAQMNRAVFIAVLAVLSSIVQCLGGETVHPDWIEADRAFVARVKAVLRTEPQHADQVLLSFPVERRSLGFGYALAEHYVGKGYLGFGCQMLYLNDKLVSFRVAPSMAPDEKLDAIYAEMLGDMFRANHDGTFEPFCFGMEAATSALPGCEVEVKMSTNMQFFCSPFSGIRYGTIGGYTGAYLENRSAYHKVADEMDATTCLRLLYSINPATRLTAYEHYRRHAVAMAAVQSKVEGRMLKVFEEVPRIETLRGCIVREEDSRQLLDSILRAKIDTKFNAEQDGTAGGSQQKSKN